MESLEEQSHCIGNSSALIDKCAQPTRGYTGDGEGVILAQDGPTVGQGTNEGFAEVKRMEFEGEGEAAASCC